MAIKINWWNPKQTNFSLHVLLWHTFSSEKSTSKSQPQQQQQQQQQQRQQPLEFITISSVFIAFSFHSGQALKPMALQVESGGDGWDHWTAVVGMKHMVNSKKTKTIKTSIWIFTQVRRRGMSIPLDVFFFLNFSQWRMSQSPERLRLATAKWLQGTRTGAGWAPLWLVRWSTLGCPGLGSFLFCVYILYIY